MIYFIAIIILLIYACIFRSIYERSVIDTTKINIIHKLASQSEPVILFFSDLHGVSFGKNNEKLLTAIDKINPDAIIIGGDMIIDKYKHMTNDSKAKENAIFLLNKLCEKYTVYYGMGNHETKSRVNDKIKAEYKNYIYRIENKNLHILANKHEYVTIKGTRFCIYGLEIEPSYYSKKALKHAEATYVEKLLGPEPEHKHSIPIVISHTPDSFDACAKWGAEYVLSGHNHGGFIRLPYIGGIIASNFRLFPKYSAGIYKHKDCISTMILSRGLGTHTIKFRLFNKPELIVIKFKPKG
ncbi:MAG: metallophosphoesterase [Lachnospiraceae bacterium]|nr:metallophosphoesterase [Lachnospiraceae bacterium]